jgi:hypothetical protein
MHYSTFVMIPEHGDINDLVARALEPFSEDLEVAAHKQYLDPTEIAAIATHYKLKKTDSKKLTTHMEDWRGCLGGVDERGLFAVSTFNPQARWDWYEIGGCRDSHLPGNVLSVQALLKQSDLKSLLPAALVTPGGSWHQWETFVSDGWRTGRFERKSDRAWLIEVRETLGSYPEHCVVCVDVHN